MQPIQLKIFSSKKPPDLDVLFSYPKSKSRVVKFELINFGISIQKFKKKNKNLRQKSKKIQISKISYPKS